MRSIRRIIVLTIPLLAIRLVSPVSATEFGELDESTQNNLYNRISNYQKDFDENSNELKTDLNTMNRFGMYKIQQMMKDWENIDESERERITRNMLRRIDEREEEMYAVACMEESPMKKRLVERLSRKYKRHLYFMKLSNMTPEKRNGELRRIREEMLSKCEPRQQRIARRLLDLKSEIEESETSYAMEKEKLEAQVRGGQIIAEEAENKLEDLEIVRDQLIHDQQLFQNRKVRVREQCARLKREVVD